MKEHKNIFISWKVLLIFVLGGILLVLSLPRNTAFQYDFQRGKEWLSDDIITPFDFPIYKSADEVYADKNEILLSYKPYFSFDDFVEQQQVTALSASLDNAFENKYNSEKGILVNLLHDVYQRGVLRKTDIPDAFARRMQLEISIVKNHISEDSPLAELYTPEDAYKYIISNFYSNKADSVCRKILSYVNIRNYIQPNLTYDAKITDKIKNQAIENISPTKGIVLAGTKLISKGDVIDANNIQTLESYKREYASNEKSMGNFWLLLLGQFLLVGVCLLLLYLMLRWYQPEIFKRTQNIVFIITITVIVVFAAMQIIKSDINVYVVPLTVVPIYISTFFRSRTAMFVYWTVILLIAFYVPNTFEFVFISFAVGIASVSEFRTWYRRGRLFISIGLILITYIGTYVIMTLLQDGSLNSINLPTLLVFAINIGIILLAYQLVYVFEKLFGFLSNTTLMELSDTNRNLLRELAEKAPGTFQHSMQVANLAEEVVRQLNGDTLLVRAGAMYHDIGKIQNPQYFVENQQTSGYSLHENMAPEESAKIIIKHVEDGLAIAKRHSLPNDVVDFIRTHHATSKTMYFVSKYKTLHPEATDFSAFAYPGPNPWTKELAVLMMADSIEAASRTLQKITPETIDNLVEEIVGKQVVNGYLDNADLSFSELTLAKKVFKSKLLTIYHARVEYPKDTK